MKKFKTFLQVLGALAVVMTLAPVIAADFWWIRIFDYLHVHLTVLTFIAACAYLIRFEIENIKDYTFMAVLVSCFIYQFIRIVPYLPHGNYEVGESAPMVPADDLIRFYAANVLQKNENPALLIREINDRNPDIILFTETNGRWRKDLSESVSGYAYRVEVPLENTYGMLLYSRLELIDPQVRYLVDDSIPSFHATLKLKSGKLVNLHCIHPMPPVPQHNPSSSDRDAEMMLIAQIVKDSKLPTIVAGDFNDVAWSGSSMLFQNVGGLLDTRVGRGFYNTFDATNPIMRWSLDHFFVTEEFRVKTFSLGGAIDSDHFPMEIVLSLEPERAAGQKPQPATENQLQRANAQIRKARKEQSEEESKKD